MSLQALLAEGRPVLVDGGLSTALEALGEDLDDPLWTARVLRDAPGRVLAAHRAFVAAGAEIVISASYQAPDELLAESVRIARRRARSSPPRSRPTAPCSRAGRSTRATTPCPTAGTSGGCGCCSRAGRDCVAIETQPRLDEAVAIAALLDGIDGWVTFTCRDGERTWHGERIEDAVAAVAAVPAVAAVGVNCTAPEFVGELLRRARSVTDLPLIAYPNAGGRWDPASNTWSAAGGFADFTGAQVIGGCCGVGPAGIAALRAERHGDRRRACQRAVGAAGERLALVQAVRAALPELDRVGHEPVAAPVRRARDRRPRSARRSRPRGPRATRGPGSPALPRRPCADAEPRARVAKYASDSASSSASTCPRGAPGAGAAARRSPARRAGSPPVRGPCGSRSW